MPCHKKKIEKIRVSSLYDKASCDRFLSSSRRDLEEAIVIQLTKFLSSIDAGRLHGLAIHFNESVGGDGVFEVTNSLHGINSLEPEKFLFPDEWNGWHDEALGGLDVVFQSYESKFKELCGELEEGDDEYYGLMERHEESYFDTFLKAMTKVRKSDSLSEDAIMLLWFSDSDNKVLEKSAKQLNSASLHKMFVKSFT